MYIACKVYSKLVLVTPTRLHCKDYNLAHIAREHALRTCIVACHTPTYCIFAHTNTSTPHTHTHTHTHTHMGLYNLQGSYFSHCFRKSNMSMNVHTCVRARTHTHTHTLTQRGLVPLAVTLVLISHTKCTCARMYTPVHTHMTHTYMHTHTHTLTQTGLVPCAVTLGSYFSHCMYMCKKTLAHCYVNSPYTIFVTNTYTHIHTLTCAHTHTHMHTHRLGL